MLKIESVLKAGPVKKREYEYITININMSDDDNWEVVKNWNRGETQRSKGFVGFTMRKKLIK